MGPTSARGGHRASMTFRISLLAAALLFAATTTAQTPLAQHNQDIFGHPLPAQHHVLVYGQRIAFYDMGPRSAPVLVLVHGYGSQADVDFGPSLPLLAKHHRVVALDQIGFGQSDKPFMQYRVQTYVDFLAEFLRVLNISKFDLCGESLGGWVVARYAEQASATGSTLPRPQRLILEDAAGFSVSPDHGDRTPPKLMVSTVDEVVRGLRAVFFDPTKITQDVARRRFISKLQANDGISAATFTGNPEVRTEATGPLARTITMPTLVVWGAEDHTVPVTDAHRYADTIPGAKLILIPRSGHVPSLEQPGAFVDALETFLK
jgi:pimeloyl-ACP methyl ester carboxylesterase